MSKKLSTRYNSLIEHYHNKNSALGPQELAAEILQYEGLDTTEDTLTRMCKKVLWASPASSLVAPIVAGNKLVVGDLHAPFILEGYLEFCKHLYKKYKCDSVLFIGDIIDAHAWAKWEADVDGMSVGDELKAAIAQLQAWYEAFPTAVVLMGNHDLRIFNKAKEAGLSREFLKPFNEVIKAPAGWTFATEYTENEVLYVHGTGVEAIKRAKESRLSVVQGDKHTLSYVQWSVSTKDRIFGMQTGVGIDQRAYSMRYADNHAKKPVIGAGVVLDHGKTPIVELMSL